MQSISANYNKMIKPFNYVVDDSGLFSFRNPIGTLVPVTVDGKRLVMLTEKRLRDGLGEDYIGFHPLSENLARRGTSPVLQHMQRMAKANISFVVDFLGRALLDISVDTALHADLPPDCSDVLQKLADADKNTVKLFDKLMNAASKKNKLVTVFLKAGGVYEGKKVHKMAVIRFPILDELESGEKEVLGIEIGKKHRKTIIALLRLLVPFGDSPEEYSAGTNTRVAPYLTVLLQAYHKIITQLNRVIHRYAEPLHLPLKAFENYPLSIIDEFPEIYNQIPAMSGNDGSVDEEEPEAAQQPAAAPGRVSINPQQPATITARPTAAAPSLISAMGNQSQMAIQPQRGNVPAPAPTQTGVKTISAREFLAGFNQPAPQQMVQMNQQPQQQLYNQYGQPVQQGMMQQQPLMVQQNPMAPANVQLPWMQQQNQQMQQQAMMQQNPFLAAVAPPAIMGQPMMVQQGMGQPQVNFGVPTNFGNSGL